LSKKVAFILSGKTEKTQANAKMYLMRLILNNVKLKRNGGHFGATVFTIIQKSNYTYQNLISFSITLSVWSTWMRMVYAPFGS
jgi:hypothetical protein